jgi:hypothetical protein
MDGPLAVNTRRNMLDRAVADRMLVEAYPFPFPACVTWSRPGPAMSWCRWNGSRYNAKIDEGYIFDSLAMSIAWA